MKEFLHKYFGFDKFLPYQEEVINDVMNGKDVIAVLPTGAGKSLCYQLPALTLPGITLVVSPLISLMKDQVEGLVESNIKAAYLNSSLTASRAREIKDELKRGEVKILYVAPERLMKTGFINFLKDLNVSLIAVDEAHCISEWGHDFRPSYRNLSDLREVFPNVPMLALTATATKKVTEDIESQLGFYKHGSYRASFNRKNLRYIVRPKQRAYEKILEYLERKKGESGIIYCHSRVSVDQMALNLSMDGLKALPYHAGLTQKERAANQEQFMRGDVQVIVATIAFGMGIDKPDIRYVIHYDLPKNLEGYYQETGRAGRDGEPSDCILFFSYSDKIKHEFFIKQKVDERQAEIARDKLEAMVNFCSAYICRRRMLLGYFGESLTGKSCGACDVCSYLQNL